jgi:hypothetical protein
MLSDFLAGRRRTIRKRHIEEDHILYVKPTSSYFTVPIDIVVEFIYEELDRASPLCICRFPGNPDKLMVWFDFQSTVGFYRKGAMWTNYVAVVIKRKNGRVTIHTAYPDMP